MILIMSQIVEIIWIKKNNNNKTTNPKISKLKTTTSPYERLELLNQLEMENKKET